MKRQPASTEFGRLAIFAEMLAVPSIACDEEGLYSPLLAGIARLLDSDFVRLYVLDEHRGLSAFARSEHLGVSVKHFSEQPPSFRERFSCASNASTEDCKVLLEATAAVAETESIDSPRQYLTFALNVTNWCSALIEAARGPKGPISSLEISAVECITVVFPAMLRNLHRREALRKLVDRDDLTGAYNVRYLRRKLVDLDMSSDEPYSLIMIDLDFLKRLNETLGHSTGSSLICSVAAVIERHISASDQLVRYGGDEFLVIAQETPKARAMALGERIRQAVEHLSSGAAHHETACTCSIGVAQYPTDGLTSAAVLQSADAALFTAKRRGRNRVECALPHLSYGDGRGIAHILQHPLQ